MAGPHPRQHRRRSGRDVRLRREDGAAAVEFAIVAILLLTIVFGIIQYGIFFERYNALVSSARDGARVAAVRGTQSAVKTEVVAATPFTINCAGGSGSACVSVAPATDPPCSSLNAGLADATVSVSYRWQPPLPFIPVPSSFTIAGVFRCE
jgi:Flp pilus assembly protein TadG